jgi:hypothetical protein
MDGKNRVKMLINKLWKTALIQAESAIAMGKACLDTRLPPKIKTLAERTIFVYPHALVYTALLLCINPSGQHRRLCILCGEFGMWPGRSTAWSEKPSVFSCTFTSPVLPLYREFSPWGVYTRMLRTGKNAGRCMHQAVDILVNCRVYPGGKTDHRNLPVDYPRIHIPNSNRYLL